ncbi:M23 family metallopeptidase [Mesorhizobium sp. J18]|uniref:M23 family metallopeptidase n=1 Tax=Mesorhizobium sp. J18 TaxID=935263 RepID=UPI002484D0CC|nr:M23 family metallopeptidase [Mesorhizobium sp. J18]
MYSPLSRIMLKIGEKITAANRLGRTGSSGRCAGPHLHREIRRDDKTVNPLAFFRAGRRISQHP